MKRAWAWVLVFGLSATTGWADGVGALAEIKIVDRDSGASLPVSRYQGEYWIAGRPGDRYAIEIRNRSGGRVLAVTSVDGVDVLSGHTAAWNQGGYVFDPDESYQIAGWRKSDRQVAAFVFTNSPDSYAERTGRPANVGVIGIALFRERLPLNADSGADMQSRRRESSDAAAAGRIYPAPAEKLGTGHGTRENSYVSRTEFERRQLFPDEVIRIRYDSRENLIAMGIIHRPRSLPSQPNPFPEAPGSTYVPDPPG